MSGDPRLAVEDCLRDTVQAADRLLKEAKRTQDALHARGDGDSDNARAIRLCSQYALIIETLLDSMAIAERLQAPRFNG
jgi:hypothetical protein